VIKGLHKACIEGDDDLPPEWIKVVIRADQLVGPFVADSDPPVLEAWLSVRTLAYSVYESDETSGPDEGNPTRPVSSVGTICLPAAPSPSKPPTSSQQTLDGSVDMDEGEATASKKPQKRKITAIGPIKSPSKAQESKKTASSSSKANKIPTKPSVDHEPFLTGTHSTWPKSVSYPFCYNSPRVLLIFF